MAARLSALVLVAALILIPLFLFRDYISLPSFNKIQPLPPMEDVRVTRDIAYAPGDRHALDIYVPSKAKSPRSVIIFLHGGLWMAGSKEEFAWVGAALARQGYVVVIPNYRLFPRSPWPKFLQDNAAAVRWTRDHVSGFGGDPNSIVLMGHSAGAYNAVSLAVDSRWLGEVGMVPKRDIKAVIGISGPYIIVPDTRKLKLIFGPEKQWPDTQPLKYVDGLSPPVLLIIGDQDRDADPHDTDRLAERLREENAVVRVIHYPALDHSGPLNMLATKTGKPSDVMENINAFIAAPAR